MGSIWHKTPLIEAPRPRAGERRVERKGELKGLKCSKVAEKKEKARKVAEKQRKNSLGTKGPKPQICWIFV